ncbi:unnamed protein product [Menidia menidia]|uniref:(Atlantic silverside) hypothetical protein n=1 Tax=Menidia menidia TaxID=238744 RepID=A0A8S4BF48_9TELE|nr:unnamed protein product [Menidia menidia]
MFSSTSTPAVHRSTPIPILLSRSCRGDTLRVPVVSSSWILPEKVQVLGNVEESLCWKQVHAVSAKKEEEKSETGMKVCWIFLIVSYCQSSHAAQHLTTNRSNELKEVYCVPAGGTARVLVPCLNASGEVTLHLYENRKLIHPDQQGSNLSLDVDIWKNEKNVSLGFILDGSKVPNNTVYSCDTIITHPPPLKTLHAQRVVVLKEGDDFTCGKCNRDPVTADREGQRPLWVWITIALLITYGLVVSIIASSLWFKWKGDESQNDYMNTPRAPQNRQRKKRPLNPFPRYV